MEAVLLGLDGERHSRAVLRFQLYVEQTQEVVDLVACHGTLAAAAARCAVRWPPWVEFRRCIHVRSTAGCHKLACIGVRDSQVSRCPSLTGCRGKC